MVEPVIFNEFHPEKKKIDIPSNIARWIKEEKCESILRKSLLSPWKLYYWRGEKGLLERVLMMRRCRKCCGCNVVIYFIDLPQAESDSVSMTK